MTKRTLLITAAAAAAIAGAGSASGQQARTLEFVTPFEGGKTVQLDLGKKGFGVGDQFLTTGQPVLDKPKGTRLGTLDGAEQIVGMAGDGTVSQQGTFRLSGGRIHWGGVARHADKPYVFPVVGGTGIYAGARGTITVSEDAKNEVAKLRIDLEE
jgi:hypothetical protein